VEGVVNAVNGPGSRGQSPTVQLHFTRLLFANGYSAALDAMNTEAILLKPEPGVDARSTDLLADARDGEPYLDEDFGGAGQTNPQPPPLPPLPHNGPNPAVIGGAVAGGLAFLLVLGITLGHHRLTHADYVLFDSGWQFQIVLQQPLTLDVA
jgi:hypothetical protein